MALGIWDILTKHYPPSQYALMKEVSDAAGFNRSRSADYIAVNLWPSRGLTIDGIELKSFRSDWLNELKNPKKAENIFKYCDYFYLLTTDDTIAKEEEIPDSWGWKYIKGEKVVIKKKAPKLTPQPISRDFMVAMLKRSADRSEFVHLSAIEDKIKAAKEEADYNSRKIIEDQKIELNAIKKNLLDFEDASGIRIQQYRYSKSYYNDEDDKPKKLGMAVKFVMDNGVGSIQKQLLGLEDTAKVILDRISEGLKVMDIEKAKVTNG